MKRNYWFVFVFLFFFANEYLSKLMLGLFVGNLGFLNAFDRTFQYASLSGYFLSAAFRAIPFIVLALISAKSHLKNGPGGRLALWLSLISLSLFHVFGYWGMQHSLFTDEKSSSTAGLALIWIPIWGTFLLGVSYAIFRITEQIIRLFQVQK